MGPLRGPTLQLSAGHVLGGLGSARGFAEGFYTHPTNHGSPRKALEIILKEVQAIGATLLGAALSTQLLLQEAGPKARGDPAGWFPYHRPVQRAAAQWQSSCHGSPD